MTLLEVLVALGIMALVLAVALPMRPRGASTIELESAAQEIAADLRETRAAAIARNKPVSFRIDVASGAYGHDRQKQLPGKTAGIHVTLFTTEQQRLSQSLGSIRFFPDGGSTGGGVALTAGARRVVVLVDWLSGQVSVAPDAAGGAS